MRAVLARAPRRFRAPSSYSSLARVTDEPRSDDLTALPSRRRRALGLLGVGLVVALAGGPAGWVISDRLEADNEFCVSCHLDEARPLHGELKRVFDAWPATNLGAKHAKASLEREHPMFRCIDCHGGTSWLGRARVKALAMKDALVYLTGRFDEPAHMRFPLWDEDCRKCHATYLGATEHDAGATPFHALSVHNTELGVGCVECHEVHEAGGTPEAYFLRAEVVRAQCARCHAEMAAP